MRPVFVGLLLLGSLGGTHRRVADSLMGAVHSTVALGWRCAAHVVLPCLAVVLRPELSSVLRFLDLYSLLAFLFLHAGPRLGASAPVRLSPCTQWDWARPGSDGFSILIDGFPAVLRTWHQGVPAQAALDLQG